MKLEDTGWVSNSPETPVVEMAGSIHAGAKKVLSIFAVGDCPPGKAMLHKQSWASTRSEREASLQLLGIDLGKSR